MRHMSAVLTGLALAIIAIVPGPARADEWWNNEEQVEQGDFCDGFYEGYRHWDHATSPMGTTLFLTPLCPLSMPHTPVGSTPFREGFKAGVTLSQEHAQERAQRRWERAQAQMPDRAPNPSLGGP